MRAKSNGTAFAGRAVWLSSSFAHSRRRRRKRLPPFSAVADNASGVLIRPGRSGPEFSGDGGARDIPRTVAIVPSGRSNAFCRLVYGLKTESRPHFLNLLPHREVAAPVPQSCCSHRLLTWRHITVSIENLQVFPTGRLLRLDPMFDPLRMIVRFALGSPRSSVELRGPTNLEN